MERKNVLIVLIVILVPIVVMGAIAVAGASNLEEQEEEGGEEETGEAVGLAAFEVPASGVSTSPAAYTAPGVLV